MGKPEQTFSPTPMKGLYLEIREQSTPKLQLFSEQPSVEKAITYQKRFSITKDIKNEPQSDTRKTCCLPLSTRKGR